jgi:peptidyl-prolyl cis-trans isomerase C
MSKKISNLLVFVLATGTLAISQTLAATSSAPGPSAPTPAQGKGLDLFPDNVVARGKGVEIKRSQLDEVMIGYKSAAAARGQPLPPEHVKMIEQQILDRLIQIQLLMAKATDTDKTVGKETTEKRIDAIKTRAGSEEKLNLQLKSVGTSQDQLRTRMTEEATAESVLERELKLTASDADVEQYYTNNPAKFEQPEMVRVSHILFATKEIKTDQDLTPQQKAAKKTLAEDVLKRARAGEDFAKLVKEYSDDPGSKDTGGEYTFARASADPQHAMVQEFETAAFALKTNQISDLVPTQYGYHIIKLLENVPAKKIELAKVSPDIKDFLKMEQLKSHQQEYQGYVAKLKKDANVEILDASLKPKDNPEATGLPSGQPPAKAGPKPAKK